ncbi:hypothetical protein BS78_02G238500 [Paspalum vaginatum]|nr:hypothetical protein BS78_02G238500 [Paspalum vaginatum]
MEGHQAASIWDTFTHEGFSFDGSTADVSADQYHHYREDVKLMHEMGLDAYRFSIACPRLIPDGRGEINQEGLEYYNNLIDELVLHGIHPHATIYHFDLPQVLQDEYGGLLCHHRFRGKKTTSEVCFKKFGDRVKHWVTVNEPSIEPIGGFDNGSQPPRRCSYPFGANCTGGDSSTEPYIAAHHLLLAHTAAVSLYRDKYKAAQGGQIGIAVLGWWHEPATSTPQDAAAAARMNDFHLGWPLGYGEYPPVMRRRVGDRLPRLSVAESARARGSFDFVVFNHYLILRVRSAERDEASQEPRDHYADAAVQRPHRVSSMGAGLGKLLEHQKLNYGNPPVLGFCSDRGQGDAPDATGEIVCDDDFMSEFLQGYLEVLNRSIRRAHCHCTHSKIDPSPSSRFPS